MATTAEKIAQIEAALRQRFFPLIPKLETADRNGWTEDQHDTDRLSRALAAYALVGSVDIDDGTAVGAITDGKNDGGIDALCFDRVGNRLVFVQAKFKRTGVAPAQNEVLKTINGFKALLDRRFEEFNQTFQDRLDEIEEALDTAGIKLCVVLAYLGDNLGQHVTNDPDALQADMNRLSARMTWEAAGLTRIYDWFVAEQTPSTVDVEVVLENWAAITAPWKAVYGQIQAAALAQLVEAHGKALFELNIRHYLGSVGVNTAIVETVRRRPGDFFYLNNGLTAVAEEITQAAGNAGRCVFGLKNMSIVNGAQTAGAITTATLSGAISADAKVLITVIEVGAGADDLGIRITRARNHQNVVRGVDFAALDPNQEKLRQELAVAGIRYHYRPSAEARARREDALTLEEAAVALACLSFRVAHSRTRTRPPQNAIDFVVAAKKEIGRLWEQDGAMYGQIFPSTLSGLRACRLVRIYRLIDRILAATEASETAYYRRMFFRHGRYFIMAFLADRLPDVIGRPELAISPNDERLISQQTKSEPLQGIRGYLSIFRNQTDCQPLADAVLDRLSEQDARAARAAAQPAATPAQAGTD